jgi:hypothetical protein
MTLRRARRPRSRVDRDMRWCRNLYAPLVKGSVNAGHPEARQKVLLYSFNVRTCRGRLLGGPPPSTGILPGWTIALKGGLRKTPGSPAQMPYVCHREPLPAHSRMPKLGTQSWRGSSTLERPQGLLSQAAREVSGRWRGRDRHSARRLICLGGVETDLRLTLARPDGCGHRGEASRSSRSPSADVEFDPV